ncbi:MAG: hypothetical protein RL088_813 [Verrucomicrobiota bacterium]
MLSGMNPRAALKALRVVLTCIVISTLLFINLRLYTKDGTEISPDAPVHADVAAQLRFLRGAIERGADADMQRLFPEGRFFMNCLYGLANVEAGLREAAGSPARKVFQNEARWALERLGSAENRAVFPTALRPRYGIFYAGWSAALHAGTLALQPEGARALSDKEALRARCDAIASAFTESKTPYLQAYEGEAWSCDSAVAIFALHACDHVLEPRYASVIERWVFGVRERLDAGTGLLGHRVSVEDGGLIEGPRATSMCITLRFLGESAPELAAELYSKFREQMMTTRLGIPGVREYPKGVNGSGDVDSGPLVFGISMSASVVTNGAARIMGDAEAVAHLVPSAEALAMPVRWGGEKRYAAGVLPVADAFIAWSQTARPWFAKTAVRSYPGFVPSWWRIPLHGVSLVVALLFTSGFLKRRPVQKTDARR